MSNNNNNNDVHGNAFYVNHSNDEVLFMVLILPVAVCPKKMRAAYNLTKFSFQY